MRKGEGTMRKMIAAAFIAAIMLAVATLPYCAFAGGETATTMYVCVEAGSVLNGRVKPDLGSEIEVYFQDGDVVTVSQIKDGWACVAGGESGAVWCKLEYLSTKEPIDEPKQYTIVANGRVRVRKAPDGKLARWAQDGETVSVTSWCGDWAFIGDGYVLKKYLEESNEGT